MKSINAYTSICIHMYGSHCNTHIKYVKITKRYLIAVLSNRPVGEAKTMSAAADTSKDTISPLQQSEYASTFTYISSHGVICNLGMTVYTNQK